MADTNLQNRLLGIEKNIQFLNGSAKWNDQLKAEYGWESPWWWFRARHFTICEMDRRGLTGNPVAEVAAQNRLLRDYSRRKKTPAIRISNLRWLSELMEGRVRFASAPSYSASSLYSSQQDDEISRSTFLPGSFFTVTKENGTREPLVGEVTFSRSFTRSIRGKSVAKPYWLLCFSTELDPRLLAEFPEEKPEEQGFFVLFDLVKFSRRVSEALETLGLIFGTVEVNYYDEHFPPNWQDGQFAAMGEKPFRFACQRELRMFLKPYGGKVVSFSSEIYIHTEKLHDIAGIYNSSGEKESGYGPRKLFSRR